jgi:hypothetical protein
MMAMVEFKFTIGDKVYLTDNLKPDVAFRAKCYTVETVLYSKSGNKYSLEGLAIGWIPEDRLVPASEAKNFAISNCAMLMQQIEALEFKA